MEDALSLFPVGVRIALGIVGLVALGAAALLAASKRAGAVRVVLWLVGSAAVALLALEQLALVIAKQGAPAGIDWGRWRWVSRAPWPAWTQVFFVAIAVATVILQVLGTRRVAHPEWRALLVGLRAGAVVACLVLVFEPAVELQDVTREANHVVVLVDESGSMALSDEGGGPTRAQRAAELVRRSGATFAEWNRRHRVSFASFSQGLVARSEEALSQPLSPGGDATRLRDALGDIARRTQGSDLAGIVIVSDGVATGAFAGGAEDGDSQRFLGGLEAPVHTVWAGRPGLRDRAIAGLGADEFAFARTVVKIGVRVRSSGFEKRSIPVTLTQAGKLVATGQVTVGGDTPEAHVEIAFSPARVGKFVYEVSVPEAPEEHVTENNRRAFVLRVIRDKVRVLQVAGRPSWDERWVRSFLEADPNVDLVSFFILRTPEDLQPVPSSEMSLIPFPTEELFEDELGSFDVILLQNFEYGPYGIAPYLDNIRRFVAEGGSLAMIGGDLSFSSGGYWGTPVGQILPVLLSPRSVGDDQLISTEMFSPRLTDEGAHHPVTQLDFDPRRSQALWDSLPRLEGMNLVEGAHPDATVLAVHPRLKKPLLAVGEHLEGRTLALTTDSLWRWGFVAAGEPGHDAAAFSTLWRNMLRWLIRDPDLERLHVESSQGEYAPGQAPRIRARIVDRAFRPAPEQDIQLVVERTRQDTPAVTITEDTLTSDDSGGVILDLETIPPGSYLVRATAQLGPRTLEASDVFVVHGARTELERPEADPTLLSTIARTTGGVALGQASSLPADLPFRAPRVTRVDRMADVELWSRPVVLWGALLLFGLEWALRRRAGHL